MTNKAEDEFRQPYGMWDTLPCIAGKDVDMALTRARCRMQIPKVAFAKAQKIIWLVPD